jgi:hypothetical chaperone protein
MLSTMEITDIALSFIESSLNIPAARARFEQAVVGKTERLLRTSSQCIADAGLKSHEIDTVFFTGGSGRVPAVREAICRAVPSARVTEGSDFLSVALGLTREATRHFR